MFVLFETAAGYAVFKLNDDKKLEKSENLFKEFENPKKASKLIKLENFEKFDDTADALTCTTSLLKGKLSKKLKKMLKKVSIGDGDQLAVADAKLGSTIKEKLNINCLSTSAVQELMACIRLQIESLIPDWTSYEDKAFQLGLSHGMGRFKLKFSAEKVDTMIIQAVSLLDDLDKELNNYVMRCKEWYGWHFPELAKIVSDNSAYINTVLAIRTRENAVNVDLSNILSDDQAEQVKELAEISMGTEIAEEDMLNIESLCRNILDLQEYRMQLNEYLKNRMMAIAPNLSVLVGDLVGARLISHAGSLVNLAKHPASTVQMLGAEKALFRALKSKSDTPKYGLIFHAQLIGQSNTKLKGKMARMLAAKSSLACRVDALGEDMGNALGVEHRARLEARLKFLEEGGIRKISSGKGKPKFEKFQHKSKIVEYKPAADSTMPSTSTGTKRKFDDEPVDVKPKKVKKEPGTVEVETEVVEEQTEKKKKKKRKHLEAEEEEETKVEVKSEPEEEPEVAESSKKKKKKKKKKADDDDDDD